MTDITSIVSLILKLLVAVVGAFLIPYLKNKYGQSKIDKVMQYVDIFVKAAEQLYDATDGVKKKQYVLDQLKALGFDINSAELDAEVESAVNTLHNQLTTDKAITAALAQK